MLGKSYLAVQLSASQKGLWYMQLKRGTVSHEVFTGIQLCQRGDSVRSGPETLSLTPAVLPLPTLSQVGLTSVVFTRRAYAQRSLLPKLTLPTFPTGPALRK
jgi:hypothetical protein